MSLPFPSKYSLWSGAILGGIVNATMTAQRKGYASNSGWARFCYVLNGGDGREGAIAFAGGHWYGDAPLVGVFHDVHSKHFRSDDEKNIDWYFQDCPAYHRSLAEQALLSWFALEHDGKMLHRVTAAFWDVGDSVIAVEPWAEILNHGVNLIEIEAIEDRDASHFQNDYQMTDEQVWFAQSIFERKLATPAARIELLPTEVEFLKSMFVDPKNTYAELERLRPSEPVDGPKWWDSIDSDAEAKETIALCEKLFAEIGIFFS